MNYGDYDAHVEKLVNIFQEFKFNFKHIDCSNVEEKFIKLNEGRFTIAVAGEVKAGKSTFLNAFLGKEVLPSDVLQATSAIIEIFKADEEFVELKYANGENKRVYDDFRTPDVNEAKEFLKNLSSVKEEYRDLPITILNSFILNHLNSEKTAAEIKEKDLKEFVSDIVNKQNSFNLHNLTKEEFEKQIRHYISEVSPQAGYLPVKITFGFPLDFEFDGFRIVDTPGVNACGGIEDLTRDYINSADALIYVTPIKPIESKSFKDFVDFSISDKSQETLLLVLTHSGHYDSEERSRLLEEGRKIFHEIDSDSIFSVDSLLRLYFHELKDMDGHEIRKKIGKIPKMKKLLSDYAWDFPDLAEDPYPFLDKISQESGFDKAQKKIEEISEHAVVIQIRNFLNPLLDKLSSFKNEIDSKISDLEILLDSPQKFEEEIAEIEGIMDEYRLNQNKFVKQLEKDFGIKTGSKNEKDVYNYIKDYRDRVNSFIENHSDIENIQTKTKSFAVKTQQDMQNKAEEIVLKTKCEIDSRILSENLSNGSVRCVTPQVDLSFAWDKAINVGKVEKSSGLGAGLAGAATGAAIGSLIPAVGTAIGAAVGGLFGWLAGGDSADEIAKKESAERERALNLFKNDFKKEINKSLDKLIIAIENSVNKLVSDYTKVYQTEINKLIEERTRDRKKLLEEAEDCKKHEKELEKLCNSRSKLEYYIEECNKVEANI